MLGQLVQDVRGRGDGVGPEEEGQPTAVGSGDEPPGGGGVAGDVDVLARFELGRLDLVGGLEQLGGLAEVEAGLEGAEVGFQHQRLARVLLADPGEGRLDGAGVEPADQAEGEEVLGALGVPRLNPGLLGHLGGDRGHRDLVDGVGGQRAVGQRVGLVAGLGQVALLEGVDVDDDGGALGQRVDVGLEGSRVHGHQHVGRVARGRDVVVGDVDLKGRHPGQGAGRGPDLGRKVGKGGQVVPQQGRGGGEAVTGQLHAVAGVAGEPDDDAVEQVRGFRFGRGVGHRAPLRTDVAALSRRTRTRRCSISSVFARINTQAPDSVPELSLPPGPACDDARSGPGRPPRAAGIDRPQATVTDGSR